MTDSTAIAKLIAKRLIERQDAKAVQFGKGYAPVREDMKDADSPLIPWHGADIVAHVEGTKTMGHYLVRPDTNTCRCIVFDFDLRKKANPDIGETPIIHDGVEVDPRRVWETNSDALYKKELAFQLRIMAEQFARRGAELLDVIALVAYSGHKGMHTYLCLNPGTPASDAREAARLVIQSMEVIVPDRGKNFWKHEDAFEAVSIEVFPKQDEVSENGFGNLVRLPLGKNQGGKAFFMDMSTSQREFKIDDPLRALQYGSIR